jgi:uncharacterized membrane protein
MVSNALIVAAFAAGLLVATSTVPRMPDGDPQPASVEECYSRCNECANRCSSGEGSNGPCHVNCQQLDQMCCEANGKKHCGSATCCCQ